MPDIAALGLAVDSSPVADATAKLNQLSAAAKAAESSAKGFAGGATQASTASAQLSQQVSKAVTSAAAIDKMLRVKTDFGAESRGEDITAYGKSLDELRAKFSPVFAIQRQYNAQVEEINKATKIGALSHAEQAQALTLAELAFKRNSLAAQRSEQSIAKSGRAAALSTFQMSNLAFQVNDVATQAALGIGPLQILAAQGGQFFQILSQGEGGVTGSLKFLGSTLLGLITPFSLAVGGATLLAGAAVLAANSWLSAQASIRLSVLGIGAASGVTVGQINAISLAVASMSNTTVGEGQRIVSALVSTGRVAADTALEAALLTKNLSKMFGEDIDDSAARLAKALADPAKGIDDLDKRLGAFDARTATHIKNLAEQGRYYEAQQILLNGVAIATDLATHSTTGWAAAWDAVRNSASRVWDVLGRGTAAVLGFDNLGNDVDAITEKIESLRRQINFAVGPGHWWFDKVWNANDVERMKAELDALTGRLFKIQQNERRTVTARDSRELQGIIDGLIGEEAAYQRLINARERLNKLASDPEVVSKLPANLQAELEFAKQKADAQIAGYKGSLSLAVQEYGLNIKSLNARTVAQKGELAFAREMARLEPSGDPDRLIKAGLARSLAIAEIEKQIADAKAQQLLSARQAVENAQLEFGLVGQTSAEQEKQRAVLQVRLELEAEAMRLYGDRNMYDQEHLKALTAEAVLRTQINAATRQASMFDDLRFDRDQMGRAQLEADVYSRLKAAGLLTNGQIESAAAQAAAEELRLNGLIKANVDASKEFTSGFVRDMMAGKSATEALANALNRLSQRLADIGTDWAFQSIFGGQGGANSLFAGLLGKSGGGATASQGGWSTTVIPSFHGGGRVGSNSGNKRSVNPAVFNGARRYHGGGIAGDEVAAILQKGEEVIPRGGRRGDGITVHLNMPVDASGAYPESIAELKSMMAKLEQVLPSRIVTVIRDAKERRLV